MANATPKETASETPAPTAAETAKPAASQSEANPEAAAEPAKQPARPVKASAKAPAKRTAKNTPGQSKTRKPSPPRKYSGDTSMTTAKNTAKDTIETMTTASNEAIKDGFEKSMKAVNDFSAFHKDTVDAVIASSTTAAKSIEELNAANLAFAKKSMEDSVAAAKKFVAWATSKPYLAMVADKEGWQNVPPGTRTSLYENPEYQKVPFAEMTLQSINSADPAKPTVEKVPYVGVQFVAIPEFQGIGTAVGQQFSAALAGSVTVDAALKSAQTITTRTMKRAGYPK